MVKIFTSEMIGEEGKVILNISDSGNGFAQEIRFVLTSQYVKPTEGTNGEKGTGTGLYVSRRILEAHDYKLNIESELGKGSTVQIHFL